MMHSILAVLIVSCQLIQVFANEDILGCSGFVKPSQELVKASGKQWKMDYDQIKVKLVTSEDIVKYDTEVAPTNGYYFLPTSSEDKGRIFYLLVQGAPGWHFEPEKVKIQVEENGACHAIGQKGADVNFYFTGFAISGQVVGENCQFENQNVKKTGPSGVSVTLSTTDGNVLKTIETNNQGVYTFNNVFPGNYILKASHPSWSLSRSEEQISVEWGNFKVAKDFVVDGYDISGRVISGAGGQREPVMGVDILLYSDTVKSIRCSPVTSNPPENGKTPLCGTRTEENGEFKFRNVPCGQYTLIPIYRGSNTTFDVTPATKTVTIISGSVVLDQPFTVVGFSITGKVSDPSGNGIKDVSIKVNGVLKTTTDSFGVYKLEQLSSGTYTIEGTKENIIFNSLVDHKISPTSAVLPTITVKGYRVCAKLVISQPPANVNPNKPRSVKVLDNQDKKIDEKTTDSNNQVCFELAPNKYKLVPNIEAGEKASGLSLNPEILEITVSNQPLLDLMFVQARVNLRGRVKCLQGSCNDKGIILTLTPRDGRQSISTSLDGSDSFLYKEVLPGNYKLSVNKNEWCWENSVLDIEVKTEDLSGVEFSQTGYSVTVSVSHAIKLQYNLVGSTEDSFVDLKTGDNQFCVKKPGNYRFIPKSCYKFEQETYSYDTSSPSVLQLTATHYTVSGIIEVPANVNDIEPIHVKVSLQRKSDATTEELVITASKKSPTLFEYSFFARVGDSIQITPSAHLHNLLFYPRNRFFYLTLPECPNHLESFSGRPGLYLSGTINPGVAGVRVSAQSETTREIIVQIETDASGSYKIGPLYDDDKYKVSAEKEGYHFEETSQGNFKAMKLAKISVSVKEQDGNGLSKVLLTLSGDTYRSNNVTNSNGQFIFYNLVGGQYFLKPMLKEYLFTPTSQTITVGDGEDSQVNFKATRVAYSCYGNVVSLNGDPEKGVTVEAIGIDGDREETQSDVNGQFRIKGLTPNKRYRINVKSDDKVSRATPSEITVDVHKDDVKDVKFIVFRKPSKLDITGNVHTDPEFLNSLEIGLYRSEDPDFMIQSVKVGPSDFFEFPLLAKGRYILRMRSSLPRQQYRYDLPQKTVDLQANSQHISISFTAKRNEEIQDIANTPLWIVVIVFGVVLAAIFYPEKVVATVQWISTLNKPKKNSVKEDEDTAKTFLPKYVHQKKK